jgi:predicted RND superfamily exporter protein
MRHILLVIRNAVFAAVMAVGLGFAAWYLSGSHI